MVKAVDQDMVDHLEGQISTLTKGTNLFRGPVRATDEYLPKEAVFVGTGEGRTPERDMAGSSFLRRVFLPITVRSQNYASGDSLARSVVGAIDGASISGYEDIRSIFSHPMLGRWTEGQELTWVITAEMVYDD